MRIAVDAMGGDYAPSEIVKGAVAAVKEYGVDVILVGPADRIKAELARNEDVGPRITIVHTDEYLLEGEHPAYTLRKKRNASILLATRLVKEGRADALVGLGPTGGVVASAVQALGTIEGMRPVVGGPFLGFAPKTLLMDVGTNVDCRPEVLLDFGVVGSVYARIMMDVPNPTVALLSVGAEEGKGNEQVLAAYPLFKKSGLNFIGNVEGNDMPDGKANVIICDGFVGNIVVKFAEGMGRVTCKWLESQLKGRVSVEDCRKITEELMAYTNASDFSGGAPLLAVNGVVCVGHGRSRWYETCRTIGAAGTAFERDMVGVMKKEVIAARARLALPTV